MMWVLRLWTRLAPGAKALLAKVPIAAPIDVVVATHFLHQQHLVIKPVQEIAPDEMILDLGPAS